MAANGGGVTVPWDNGVKKIARMGLPFYPIAAQKAMSEAWPTNPSQPAAGNPLEIKQ